MRTLEQLRLDHQEAKQGHPVHKYFRGEYKVKKPKTAAQLEALLEEYVNLSGGKVSIISSAGRQMVTKTAITDVLGRANTITDSKYIPSTTVKGTPDLLGVAPGGKALAVEVKFSHSDRMRPEQKIYKEAWEQAGGVFIIAKTLEQFIEIFNTI